MMDEAEATPEDLKTVLEAHVSTGEPSASALARVRARVLARARPPAVEGRRWLPPEVMAVAAVLVIAVAAQGLYLAFRATPPVPDVPMPAVVPAELAQQLAEVTRQYVKGDLPGARAHAASCTHPQCAALAKRLERISELSAHLDTLAAGELEELWNLDAEISGANSTTLGQSLNRRLASSPAALKEAQALFKEGNEERKAKNYDRAAGLLEKCIKAAPTFPDCYRTLASVYASIAQRDNSLADRERAKWNYQRFLQIAPPDDDYVPKVRSLLDSTQEYERPASVPASVPVPVTLKRGQTIERELPAGVSRVAISDPEIVEVEVGVGTCRLRGVTTGSAVVLLWTKDGQRVMWSVDVTL